jgi:hypothetical protein
MSIDRNAIRSFRRLAAATLLPLLLGALPGAAAADSGAPSVPAGERTVTLESVPGSPVKRVVLSAKAAERLGVRTGEIGEQVVAPTLMVGGVVVDPSAAGTAAQPATGGGKPGTDVWIRAALSPVEFAKLAKDKPVHILPLATRSGVAKDLTAMPLGEAPRDNARSGMLTLFYVARAEGSGLVPGDRVRVEMPLEGGVDRHKVVPYSAVYYDAKGDAWVYVTSAPLAFARERITVLRVVGDLALLSSGPPAGTQVVTVGAALLYGAEVFGK